MGNIVLDDKNEIRANRLSSDNNDISDIEFFIYLFSITTIQLRF